MTAYLRASSPMMKKQQENHQQNQQNQKKKKKTEKPTTSEGHPGIGLLSLGPTMFSDSDPESESVIDIGH